ncbi:hypothetical protein EYF80_064160 [Liparis tanakae]|uniref:Uncharacterized protein n=1 Tax=Liparis tanakae TaxID=230148 RepID=A0A4Z2EA57_9TELE|nr:hypothetical protein EYF80_064160 [Liparis tanakae]
MYQNTDDEGHLGDMNFVTPVEKRWCSSYTSALKKKDSAAPNARPSVRKKAMMAPAVSAS